LSRSCRTPRVLTPKYWDVGPGIPSSLNPGATRGERLVSSWMIVLRWLVVGAVMESTEVVFNQTVQEIHFLWLKFATAHKKSKESIRLRVEIAKRPR
jgi:hypothetical protein